MVARNQRLAMPIEFAAQVRDIVHRARPHGVDVAEALNFKDLLLTPAHVQRIEVAMLQRFADELQRWEPHEMLRREYRTEGGRTPADMYRVVQGFLDEFIEYRKEGRP